jgi:hypothetical protein
MKKNKREILRVRRGVMEKIIETPDLLAILNVPVVYPPETPTEPLLEAKTVKLLDEARRRAKGGDRAWLRKHGAKLYVSSPAA